MMQLCNCSSVSVKSVTQSVSKSWSVNQPVIQSVVQSVRVSLLVTKRVSYRVIKLCMDEAIIYPCLGKVIKSHLPFEFLFFFHDIENPLYFAMPSHAIACQCKLLPGKLQMNSQHLVALLSTWKMCRCRFFPPREKGYFSPPFVS